MKDILCKSSIQKATQFKFKLNNNDDVILRQIKLKDKFGCLLFLENLVDVNQVNLNIIYSLNDYAKTAKTKFNLEELLTGLNSVCDVMATKDIEQAEGKLLMGYAILFVDDEQNILCFNVVEHKTRAITEPPSSMVIRGPREGFTENIKINLGLLRKRLLTKNLKIESLQVGKETSTSVKIVYLSNIASSQVVDEVKQKLNAIDIDGVLDAFYLQKYLEDRPNSIFKQVGSSEKPDIVTAKILEGRVAVMCDNSPVVLTVPFLLMEDLQNSNDYYSEAHRATQLRVLRLFGAMLAIFLPGAYIALQLYHYKVFPLKLLVTIINSTQNLPLNPFLEIFFIIILFEILFEASLRMPKFLGVAISIVGALILGDTAVKAGLVSPPGVMIVALSAITIYIIPDQYTQISTLRLLFALIGGLLGFQGIIMGVIFMVAYLNTFEQFGSAYLAPYAPYVKSDQKDFVLKEPINQMELRPKSIRQTNKRRQK